MDKRAGFLLMCPLPSLHIIANGQREIAAVSLVMMMAFAPAFSGVISLILRFDGSLKPPRDPIPGFTYKSSKNNFGCADFFASCGAALFVDNHEVPTSCEGDNSLIALGGKLLPSVQGTTSADVEYDGLLFGLDWLIDTLSVETPFEENIFDSTIIIQGDCKAVIDQLNSRSSPRKMETKHCMVLEKLQKIQDLRALHQSRNDQKATIQFHHVPREENALCDAICKLVINQRQMDIVASIIEEIKQGEMNASQHVPSNIDNHNKLKKSKKKNILASEKSSFRTAMQSIFEIQHNNASISTCSLLCYSSRLALACELTNAATRSKDGVALHYASEFFLRTSRRWSRIYYLESSKDTNSCTVADDVKDIVNGDILRKVGIVADFLSLTVLGFTEDAKNLAKKYKLNDDIMDYDIHASVLGLMVKSMLKFYTKFDGSSNGGKVVNWSPALSPYVAIDGMIDSVEHTTQKSALDRWNQLVGQDDLSLYDGIWLTKNST